MTKYKFKCENCNPDEPCVLIVPVPIMDPYCCPMKDWPEGKKMPYQMVKAGWVRTEIME